MQRFLKRSENTDELRLPGLPGWLSDLLIARGMDTPDKARAFLFPESRGYNDPFLLHDMDKAIRLIHEARRDGVRAVVYGDYDVDGICASAIMHQTLCVFGLDAAVYIPDRHEEGYGLNADAVRSLSERAGLLVTVDCGVTGADEVRLARELGMRVIVTDHHTLPPELPEADALVDPLLPPYPFPSLCGAGVAFQLCRALLGHEAALSCLDLAALATVADLVPLVDENRLIVKQGLAALERTERPGLKALMQAAGITGSLTSDRIAFGLAPRLNASGRLQSALTALSLIQEGDSDEAMKKAMLLERLNAERKDLEKQVLEDAESQLSAFDLCEDRAIVICGEGYESGVVGLAAGRLAEKTGYPTVILARREDLAVGSARSAGGVDIYKALFACRHFFLRFGGHKQAAGMTLRYEDVPAFRRELSEAVRAQLNGRPLVPTRYYDAELSLPEVSRETVEQLRLLEPFGMGNPEPVFLLKDTELLNARTVGSAGAHLKLLLTDGTVRREGIAFRMGELMDSLPQRADILFSPTENAFRDRVSYECRISAIRPDMESVAVPPERIARAALQDFCTETENIIPSTLLPWSEALADEWAGAGQGTLVFCRTRDTAFFWHRRHPQLDLLTLPAGDTRAYSAVIYGVSANDIRAPYRRVILADGDLTGADASLFPPQAGRVFLIPPASLPLKRLMEDMRPAVDLLRLTYVVLKRGPSPRSSPDLAGKLGVSPERTEALLAVLSRMGLIDISFKPFLITLPPMKKADPAEDQLFITLNAWKGG